MVKVVEQISPPRRKRFNKNKKKAWRKKTNISEVEERLEDERREERYGGPLEERKDSEMMFVDLGDGDGEANKTETGGEELTLEYTVDEVPADSGKVQLKPRKVKVKKAKLKSHEFINGLPGAKPPRKPKKGQGTLTMSMKKKKERQSQDPRIIKKRVEAMSQIVQDYQKSIKKPKTVIKGNYNTDLWAEGADEVTKECKKKGLEESFITAISDYYRRERRMKPVKVPKVRHVPTSKLDAVTVPHPGASYNPSYESHQKLLLRAVKQEEKRLRKEEKVEKATTKMFPTIDKAPSQASWLAEMSEGLPNAADDDEDEEEDEDEEVKEKKEEEEEEEEEKEREETEETQEEEKAEEAADNLEIENEENSSQEDKAEQSEETAEPKKKTKQAPSDKVTVSCKPQSERKTKKVRRKEMRLKLQQIKKQKEKEERIRSSNIYKLKTYQKEIVKEDQEAEQRTASRRARKERLKSMPRRLANMKFEEEDLAVNLGDELPDSLRTVAPVVELLEERFKNLQRRNILEPRQKHKLKRKYKPKVVLKRGHREELARIEKMDYAD